MRFTMDDGSPAWHDAAARPGTASGWVPCPAQDSPAALGAPVWSVRLYERHVWGLDVEQRYGSRGGTLLAPVALTVRAARKEHCCQGTGCGHLIQPGQHHGAEMITPEITGSSRYCPCCITATEPASTFRDASGTILEPLSRGAA